MDQYVIVIETGYKTASANYRIKPTDPMSLDEAQQLFAALLAGRDDRLEAQEGATVVQVSDTQFLRFRSRHGATVLDRVSLGPAHTQ